MLDLTSDTFDKGSHQRPKLLFSLISGRHGAGAWMVGRFLKNIKRILKKLKFSKMNVDDNQEIAAKHDVRESHA